VDTAPLRTFHQLNSNDAPHIEPSEANSETASTNEVTTTERRRPTRDAVGTPFVNFEPKIVGAQFLHRTLRGKALKNQIF